MQIITQSYLDKEARCNKKNYILLTVDSFFSTNHFRETFLWRWILLSETLLPNILFLSFYSHSSSSKLSYNKDYNFYSIVNLKIKIILF